MMLTRLGLLAFALSSTWAQTAKSTAEDNLKVLSLGPNFPQHVTMHLRPQTAPQLIVVGSEAVVSDLVLRLPSGISVTAQSALASGFGWVTDPGDGLNLKRSCPSARAWTLIGVPNTQPEGDFDLEASAPQAQRATTLCVTHFSVDFGSNQADLIGEAIKTDRDFYTLGDSVVIIAPGSPDDSPSKDTQIEATVNYRRGVAILGEAGRVLLKEKERVYKGVFAPSAPGDYVVSVTIPGKTQLQETSFTVGAVYARLKSAALAPVGGVQRATVRLDVLSPGQYGIVCILRSSEGRSTNSLVLSNLIPGEQAVTLDFRLSELRELEMKPPYQLMEVHIDKKDPGVKFGSVLVGEWVRDAGRWRSK